MNQKLHINATVEDDFYYDTIEEFRKYHPKARINTINKRYFAGQCTRCNKDLYVDDKYMIIRNALVCDECASK